MGQQMFLRNGQWVPHSRLAQINKEEEAKKLAQEVKVEEEAPVLETSKVEEVKPEEVVEPITDPARLLEAPKEVVEPEQDNTGTPETEKVSDTPKE